MFFDRDEDGREILREALRPFASALLPASKAYKLTMAAPCPVCRRRRWRRAGSRRGTRHRRNDRKDLPWECLCEDRHQPPGRSGQARRRLLQSTHEITCPSRVFPAAPPIGGGTARICAHRFSTHPGCPLWVISCCDEHSASSPLCPQKLPQLTAERRGS
jgi:hypothetical protein